MHSILLQIPDQIDGFSRTEYLSVFIGFLYAAVASEFLIHWGKMFRNRNELTFSPELIAWSLLFFVAILVNWYNVWPHHKYIGKSFGNFVLAMLPVMIFYFLAIWLFPDLEKEADMNVQFQKNARWILLLFAGYFLSLIASDLLVDSRSLFSINNLLRFIAVIFSIISFARNTSRSRWLLFGIIIILFAFAIINSHD